jgi:hypothetical protein
MRTNKSILEIIQRKKVAKVERQAAKEKEKENGVCPY